jgi:hypothetical protein
VRGLLPQHDVYITDWTDARMVPLSEGPFHLHDYIYYVQDFIRLLGPDVHVFCLPANRTGTGGDFADGDRERSEAAKIHDDDGRPDRSAQLSDAS